MTTLVRGPIKLVTDRSDTVRKINLRAPELRLHGAGIVTDHNDDIPVVDGQVEFEALPGPAVLTLVTAGGAPLRSVDIVVPDEDTATLAECLDQIYTYDPPVVGRAQQFAREAGEHAARAEAGAARVGSAEQVGQWVGEAEVLHDDTVAAANHADTQAGIAAEQAGVAGEHRQKAEEAEGSAHAAAEATADSAELSEDATAVAVAASLGFMGFAPEQVIDAATRSESARDTAVDAAGAARDAASSSADDRSYVSGVREELEETYAASESGQALPPRLTDSGLSKTFIRQDDRAIHVRHFGAIGDGVADDTAAVEAAVRSDLPIYWGDHTDRYRITNTVTRNRSDLGPVTWRSDGATIICDPEEPVRRAVWLNMSGERVSITGPLTIDANRMAFIGFCMDNNSQTDLDDALISELTVINVHRSSNQYAGGDGVLIRGGFNRLAIENLTVRNVTMVAGIYGVDGHINEGVAGLSVMAFSPERSPRYVHISAPVIDGVYDEDTSHHDSQNGIRLFGSASELGRPMPFHHTFNLVGGTVRNCGGRAVKVQRQWGSITGLKIYRDIPRTPGKAEIDFQRSGGRVTDLYVQYEGASSAEVVKFGAPPSESEIVAHGSVDGLRLVVDGDQVPNSIVTSNQSTDKGWRVVLRDIETIGTQPHRVLSLNGESGGSNSVSLSDVFSAPTFALIRAAGGTPSGWGGVVSVTNCVNTGVDEIPVFASVSDDYPRPELRVTNAAGFTFAELSVVRSVLSTSEETTSGWNNLQIESGIGEIYAPSYFRPPAGAYRLTYLSKSEEPFERLIRDRDADTRSRITVTPSGGMWEEVVQFSGSSYLRITGATTDLFIVLEKIL